LGFLYWVRIFSFTDGNNGVNIIFFFTLFLGVNLVFFPMHEIRLDGLPRRYFSYIDIFRGICLLTILRTLFTISGWGALIILLIINTNSIRSLGRKRED